MTPAAVPLYDYQKRWFLDRARFKIGKFARQTGKTFTTTLEIVDDCFAQDLKGGRTRWVILSRGERQASEAMNEGVKVHAKAYGAALNSIEYDFRDERGDVVCKALEVTFPNGSKITALPANPDTARGFSANVFLDEFAFHQNSRAIWGALFPIVSAGFKLRVTSTPNGKSGKFYELMTANDDRWSRHVVDIYKAVADGLPRDVDELREALNDADLWAQEYELKWLDEASAWLTYDLIDAVEDSDAGAPELYQGGPCFIGNDIAARRDLWVAWVFELVGDVLWTREIVERRRISFAEQDAIMDELMDRYDVVRLAMDQTGMGEKPVEDAKRRYGEFKVDGVILSSARRLAVATAGKQAFEDRKLRIPAGNQPLRADLHKLKKTVGPTGAPRLVATRDEDHADRTWAGFLGIAAADNPTPPPAGASSDPEPDDYRSGGPEDRRTDRIFGRRPRTKVSRRAG